MALVCGHDKRQLLYNANIAINSPISSPHITYND